MSDLMAFSGFFVCADCKPLAVAKLARGEAIGGYWRDRSNLVLAIGRSLPERCVRCNEPSEGFRLKRNLYWHSPALYVLVLLSPIVYLLVAVIVRKRAKVEVPVCPAHRHQRKQRLLACTGVGLAAVLGLVGVIAYMKSSDLALGLGLASVMIILGAIVASVIFGRFVEPTKITKTHIFLKGVREPFLAELPVWPR